jgi:hypothetical protein
MESEPEEFRPSEEARSLYDKYWAEGQTRMRSSSENFDKSILTYSSSGLAISLAFLKDFVPIKDAVAPSILYFSWLCFVIATGLTISSFLVSYKAQELSVSFAEKYLLEGDHNFYNKTTWRDKFIKWSNVVSGAAFVIALVATSIFVGLNLDRKADMAIKGTLAQEGMPVALVQKNNSTETKGLPTASMPVSQRPASPPASSSQSNSTSDQKK